MWRTNLANKFAFFCFSNEGFQFFLIKFGNFRMTLSWNGSIMVKFISEGCKICPKPLPWVALCVKNLTEFSAIAVTKIRRLDYKLFRELWNSWRAWTLSKFLRFVKNVRVVQLELSGFGSNQRQSQCNMKNMLSRYKNHIGEDPPFQIWQ